MHTSTGYTVIEERLHAATHGVGALLSMIGLAWMMTLSIATSDPWRIAASGIYGLSMVALFLASTLYHSWPDSPRRHLFKLLDHCAIYLLIAGTYTPFLLVAMRGHTGWWLFGGIWTLASIGIWAKLWLGHRYPILSLASYLIMGWLVVLAGPQVADAIGGRGMAWLVAGGLSYTVGAVFYAARSVPYNHTIWHLFVLAGGLCHFLAVVWHVLPVKLPAGGQAL